MLIGIMLFLGKCMQIAREVWQVSGRKKKHALSQVTVTLVFHNALCCLSNTDPLSSPLSLSPLNLALSYQPALNNTHMLRWPGHYYGMSPALKAFLGKLNHAGRIRKSTFPALCFLAKAPLVQMDQKMSIN